MRDSLVRLVNLLHHLRRRREDGAAQDDREREWLEAPNGDGTAAVLAAKDMFNTLGNHSSKCPSDDL